MLDFAALGVEVPADAQTKINAQVEALVKDSVSKEVSGLKSKNDELLGTVKGFQEKLKAFDGIDPVRTRELFDKFNKDEELSLLKDGKVDQLIDKRVSEARAKFDDEMKGKLAELEVAAKERDAYRHRFEAHLVRDRVGQIALEAKVIPSALDDIARRAMEVFRVNEKGELEARDKDGNLLKTEAGELLTPARFIEALKKAAPHYWPASASGSLNGSGPEPGSDKEAAMLRAAEAGDLKLYRRLRDGK